MAVKLTERAAEEVKRAMTAPTWPAETVLRVGVAGGGCSGLQYSLAPDKYDAKNDSKYEYHGVTVIVDKKSALYLDETTIDHYDGIDKRGFVFDNPQAVKSCGCGHSFSA